MRNVSDTTMLREAAARCRALAELAEDEVWAEKLRQDAIALEAHAAEIEARGRYR